ncbi:MAG: thioredoxin family protein [Krumholzibacteria bacterium]|nr:thioredoxin family protein [Candidatus Krumholzibacteria bacterium]
MRIRCQRGRPAARHALPLRALVVLLALAAAPPAAAASLTLEVAGDAPAAEIGQDLVLQLVLRSAGATLDPAAVVVRVEAPGGFLGTPYPLRPLAGGSARELRFEWAAPVAAGTAAGPRTLTLLAEAPGPDGTLTARWSGTVAVDYGKDWSADRITAFIDQRGLPFFLVLVFGFGILMSLSPCIYPMIPITLAVIGARSQDKGAAHGLAMSVTYVLGMALVYAVLGALSATVFSGITAFMQSPVVVGPIALLLVALAFSMFGAFELQAPRFMRDRLQGTGGARSGVVGVFAMGMVAGLVASPCVGPFLAALLVWVATTGNWVLGFVSLFAFGLGMGLLLIGVGTFPALLGSMPRSGGWMETIKKAMGLLLLAMAFWFVRPGIFLPAAVFYPLLGATAILVGVFLGAFDAVAPGTGWWDRTRKGLGIIALVAGLYLLGGSFLAHGLLMPSPLPGTAAVRTVPAPTGQTTAAADQAATLPDKVAWELVRTGDGARAFLDTRLAEAKAAGRPVLIDFWAEWCVYCKKLDKSVWNQPAVVGEAQRFLTIKVDATAPDDAEMAAIKAGWDVAGLPRVVFIDSRGEYLAGRSTGFLEADQMLERMQSIR